MKKTNHNHQQGLTPSNPIGDTGEEGSFLAKKYLTFHTTSPVHKIELCEYSNSICPKNIHKYTMKCLYGKDKCAIKRFFDRYKRVGLDINKLGIGSKI